MRARRSLTLTLTLTLLLMALSPVVDAGEEPASADPDAQAPDVDADADAQAPDVDADPDAQTPDDGGEPGAVLVTPPRPDSAAGALRPGWRPRGSGPVPPRFDPPSGTYHGHSYRSRPDPASLTRPLDGEAHRNPDATYPTWIENDDRRRLSLIRYEGALWLPGSDAGGLGLGGRLGFIDLLFPLTSDYRAHDRLLSLGGEFLGYGVLDHSSDRDDDAVWDVLSARLQYDARWVGGSLGVTLLNVLGERGALFSPTLGLRAGLPEVVQVTLHVHLRDLFISGFEGRTRGLSNLDVEAAVAWSVDDIWSVQARGRAREVAYAPLENGAVQGRALRELRLAVGVEVGGPLGLRITPLFVGVGVRHVIEHLRVAADGAAALEPAGASPMLWIDLDLGLHGASALW